MAKLITGGELAARTLEDLGVKRVFAIPSAHNMSILSAIEARKVISVISCRHEQGVVHAADAYARVSGELGVAIVSGGPGTANTMGGMYEAYFASSPVLLITSQVEVSHLGRSRGYVHEAESQADMLRTVCREVSTVLHTEEIAEAILRLADLSLTGRPRPVAIEIPIDVQDELIVAPTSSDLVPKARSPRSRLAPKIRDVQEAAALLSSARRPIIWAGGGVNRSGAAEALLELAQKWNAPVITSREGRGAISEFDPLSIGGYAALPPMSEYLAECDVMLAVGTRFQMYPTGVWTLPLPVNLVHLDVDPTVIGRSYPATVSVIADADLGLGAITAALPELSQEQLTDRRSHLEFGQQAAAAARQVVALQAGVDHLAISKIITELRPAESPLVLDATVPAYVWGDRLVPISAPRTSIRSTAAGIGPGMAMALGAALASETHTILVQGDGGFMLGLGELASALQAQAKVVVCLFDDKGYGMLRDIQGIMDNGYVDHVDLATPDFYELARSFGVQAARAGSPTEFRDALLSALEHAGPTLIHIDMSKLKAMQRTLGT